jgi:hypothetical protein
MTKQKFRTNTYDALPAAPEPKPQPPHNAQGPTPEGRLAVYDGNGRRRAAVGPKATAATVSRFIGKHGAKLGKGPDGRQAWIGPTLAEVSAKGSHAPGATGDDLADVSSRGATTKLAGQLRQAKGSVSK